MARLQALALEPVRSEDDYIECKAFQGIAVDVQFLFRHSGAKPDEIVAGWEDHFVMLVREDGRAGIRIVKKRRDRPAGAHFRKPGHPRSDRRGRQAHPLAVLASPFMSKLHLEVENAVLRIS